MTFAKKVLVTGLCIGGTLGALALANKVTESMAGELDTVLTGEERRYAWKYGDMFYTVKGSREARPLVLIHGLGPGASSYEWRKNIDALAEQFRVYALDLLGYGLSDRQSVEYDAEMYIDLISDFVKEIVNKPAVVIAHGMSSVYAIAAAFRRPALFERLVLVAPPATILQESYPGPLNTLSKLGLRLPIIGQFVYNVLTSRQTIRGYYDRQGYHNPGLITDELVEYVYTSAHQPNSRFAVASQFGGLLHSDIHEQLSRLTMPIAVVWGREGTTLVPSEASSAFKRVNPRIEVQILDKSNIQVQDEQAAQFNTLVRNFASVAVK